MKLLRLVALALSIPAVLPAADFVENHDTLYNNLTIERRGTVVELRARSIVRLL